MFICTWRTNANVSLIAKMHLFVSCLQGSTSTTPIYTSLYIAHKCKCEGEDEVVCSFFAWLELLRSLCINTHLCSSYLHTFLRTCTSLQFACTTFTTSVSQLYPFVHCTRMQLWIWLSTHACLQLTCTTTTTMLASRLYMFVHGILKPDCKPT